jgi:hypothetical protein
LVGALLDCISFVPNCCLARRSCYKSTQGCILCPKKSPKKTGGGTIRGKMKLNNNKHINYRNPLIKTPPFFRKRKKERKDKNMKDWS